MSNWAHVNGSVRIDSIRGLDENSDEVNEKIKKAFGEICRFEDDDFVTILPCGSEGSLEYTIWDNPSKSSVAAFTVNIFGDLRDYDDTYYIIEWFKKAVSDFTIRSAVLEIFNQDGTIVISHSQESDIIGEDLITIKKFKIFKY